MARPTHRSILATTVATWALALGAAPAVAAEDPTPENNDSVGDIVVTATKVNAETPITSSVHTTEPQSVVSRSIIEDSVPPTADFAEVIQLTPSASNLSSPNGPGLGDSKTVLRGFQDGQYNITYDGIPFGDSNDPTHHSTSYFPSGTYERIIIDRGPGSATDLGQASYGGNVHLISREARDHFGLEGQAVYGSFNTMLGRLTLQTGAIDALGGLKMVAIGEYKRTDGAQTGQSGYYVNGFVKLEKALGENATISLLGSYNQSLFHQSDAGVAGCFDGPVPSRTGLAPAEVSQGSCDPHSEIGVYGKNFGLAPVTDSRFAAGPFATARPDWNWENKTTDFEIARLQVALTDNLSFDNKLYTYFYKNFTFSAEDTTSACVTGTATTCFESAANTGSASGQTFTIVNGKQVATPGDIPGYTKVNQYRQSGDIAQFNWKTPIGVAHVGLWVEVSASHRYRYDYDVTRAFANGAISDYHFDFATTPNFFNYKEKTGVFQLDGTPVPRYVKYDEHTSWLQVQGFGEFEFKLLDDRLTITPGVKVQDFTRSIATPIAAQSSRVGIISSQSYKPTLPYFSVNFLVRPDLSFYAQFAKGFLIPALSSSLEVLTPAPGGLASGTALQPTKTTNYQAGFVYAGDRLNIDADVYYIQSSNSTFVNPVNQTVTQNTSGATYKGVEAQISYLIFRGLTVVANGSLNSAKNDATHQWLAQSPDYTALLGIVYNRDGFKLSYLHKFTGRQYSDPTQLVALAPYSLGVLAASYSFRNFTLGASVYNLFNNRSTTSLGGDTNAATAQYAFQSPRSYQVQAKVRF